MTFHRLIFYVKIRGVAAGAGPQAQGKEGRQNGKNYNAFSCMRGTMGEEGTIDIGFFSFSLII